MKKVLIFAVVFSIVLAISFSACSSAYKTRYSGGTMAIELNPGEKLLGITWKESKWSKEQTQIWYLVELPDGTCEFRQHDGSGKVIIKHKTSNLPPEKR